MESNSLLVLIISSSSCVGVNDCVRYCAFQEQMREAVGAPNLRAYSAFQSESSVEGGEKGEEER